MTLGLYILEGKDFRPATSLREWGRYMESARDNPYYRHVADTNYYINEKYYCRLSTVFLGIDHSYSDSGDVVLFETMLFDGSFEEMQWRYTNWNEAKISHYRIHEDIVLPEMVARFSARFDRWSTTVGEHNSIGDHGDIRKYYYYSLVKPKPPEKKLPIPTDRLIRED